MENVHTTSKIRQHNRKNMRLKLTEINTSSCKKRREKIKCTFRIKIKRIENTISSFLNKDMHIFTCKRKNKGIENAISCFKNMHILFTTFYKNLPV